MNVLFVHSDDYNNFNFVFTALQAKLNDEKTQRMQAENTGQEVERQLSMLSVDFRQVRAELQKMEGQLRQEVEKSKGLVVQLEQEAQRRAQLQSDLNMQSSEISLLKSKEKQLQRELSEVREAKKSLEEELQKIKAAKAVDDLQMKELQEQLDTEMHFSVGFIKPFLCLSFYFFFNYSYLLQCYFRLLMSFFYLKTTNRVKFCINCFRRCTKLS